MKSNAVGHLYLVLPQKPLRFALLLVQSFQLISTPFLTLPDTCFFFSCTKPPRPHSIFSSPVCTWGTQTRGSNKVAHFSYPKADVEAVTMYVCPVTQHSEHSVSPSGRGQLADPRRLRLVFSFEQKLRFEVSYVREQATLPGGLHAVA